MSENDNEIITQRRAHLTALPTDTMADQTFRSLLAAEQQLAGCSTARSSESVRFVRLQAGRRNALGSISVL